MGMADHDVARLAGVDDPGHRVPHLRVVVLAGEAELLAEIAFADQHRADPRHVVQHVVQVLDPRRILDHQDDEDLAVRRERPHIGLSVVLLLRQPPVAHGMARSVAAHPGRLVERRVLEAGVAARSDRVIGLLDAAHMRPDHPVDAEIERLLGVPLAPFRAVGRDADHGGDRRRDGPGGGDPGAVEHVLQRIAQRADVPRVVLQFEDDAVIARRRHGDGALDVGGGEGGEGALSGFQRADDAVEPRYLRHPGLRRVCCDGGNLAAGAGRVTRPGAFATPRGAEAGRRP